MEKKLGNVFVDLETTGFRSTDEILSIAMVDENGNVLLDSLVKPSLVKEWPEAENVNHISPEMVAAAPSMEELQPKINEILGKASCLISYGISFDYRFLEKWLYTPVKENIQKDCCLARAKANYPGISHKLSNMMDVLGLTWTGTSHSALPDTIACKDVWQIIEKNFSKRRGV